MSKEEATGTECPFCKEEILEGALKCKHCGEYQRDPRLSKKGFIANDANAGCLGLLLGPVGLWAKGQWAAGFAWLVFGPILGAILVVFTGWIALPILWIGMAIHAYKAPVAGGSRYLREVREESRQESRKNQYGFRHVALVLFGLFILAVIAGSLSDSPSVSSAPRLRSGPGATGSAEIDQRITDTFLDSVRGMRDTLVANMVTAMTDAGESKVEVAEALALGLFLQDAKAFRGKLGVPGHEWKRVPLNKVIKEVEVRITELKESGAIEPGVFEPENLRKFRMISGLRKSLFPDRLEPDGTRAAPGPTTRPTSPAPMGDRNAVCLDVKSVRVEALEHARSFGVSKMI